MRTYAGALLNRQSAQLDAYKAATQLFRYHIKKDHLQIFTYTKISSCEETPQGCRLKTKDDRTIRCKYVIVAAGFEAGQFLPEKVMKLTSTYALISHPIDNKDLWPEHSLIWETAEPYIYVRTTGEDNQYTNDQLPFFRGIKIPNSKCGFQSQDQAYKPNCKTNHIRFVFTSIKQSFIC